MIVIVNNPLSGIGQVTIKYAELLECEQGDIKNSYENETLFVFALPVDYHIDRLKELKKKNKILCMTVCETKTVNPVYGKLFELFDHFVVPSTFCKDVFSKQFPDTTFSVIPHCVSPILDVTTTLTFTGKKPYVFYHIGNIADPRKQVNKIIQAFISCKFENAVLILKATCNTDVKLNVPGVYVFNGLLDNKTLDVIHNTGDCYVSFSYSEGVGMGAVEAAVRNKPVIISEFGGAIEYIKTPYVVPCEPKMVGYTDFLFTPTLEWGNPDFDKLCEYMKDAYNKNLSYMDHEHTREFINPTKIKHFFEN